MLENGISTDITKLFKTFNKPQWESSHAPRGYTHLPPVLPTLISEYRYSSEAQAQFFLMA
jgi:nitrate reductase cytochrome c-type subunit